MPLPPVIAPTPPPYRWQVTLSFLQKAQGWSETHYQETANPSYQTQMNTAKVMAQKRAAWMGTDTQITYVRVSRADVLGDSLLEYVGSDITYQGASGQSSDFYDTALQCVFKDSTGAFSRQMFARGIWDRLVQAGGGFTPNDPVFKPIFAAWVAYMVQPPSYGWLRTRGVVPLKDGVTDIVQLGNGKLQLTLVGIVFAPYAGKVVSLRVSKAVGGGMVNGSHLFAVSATGGILISERKIAFTPYTVNSAVVQGAVPIFTAYDKIVGTKTVERKAGRPLYSQAGRRKVPRQT